MSPSTPAQSVERRWPAEWEPLEAVWVAPPHNAETWPGCLEAACAQHAAWCDAMRPVVEVRSTGQWGIASNDAWIRDFGPLFVHETPLNDAGRPAGPTRLAVEDFRFNAWGGKYETRDLDDAATAQIAHRLGLPCRRHEQVLEGGALETDGRGTLLSTTDCLLSPSRQNPAHGPAKRDTIEAMLGDALGTRRIIWLEVDLPGDDTDGHIDNAARFVNPQTVVVHPAIDATPLLEAGLDVLRLPAVPTLYYDYPGDRLGPGGRKALPCSYANFLIANASVFVPAFGVASDDAAFRLLDDAMPRHRIVPVRAEHLLVGLGGPHCLSMQQPQAHVQ